MPGISSGRHSRDSFGILKAVVDEYVARGVQAEANRFEVIRGLDQVVNAAEGEPLFLFLDPCGLGIPFSVLVQTSVRAAGGHVASHGDPAELQPGCGSAYCGSCHVSDA